MPAEVIFVEAPAFGPVLDAVFVREHNAAWWGVWLCEFEHGVTREFPTGGDHLSAGDLIGVDVRHVARIVRDSERQFEDSKQRVLSREADRAYYRSRLERRYG